VRFVLLVPVPERDREDRRLPAARRRAALKALLHSLGAWFGSATALPSWGSWKASAGDPVAIDARQAVVLVLTTPGKFRRRRPALTRLLRRLGRALDQEQMAAIAFRSAKGSLLIRCRT
jgi:hypothetical protein